MKTMLKRISKKKEKLDSLRPLPPEIIKNLDDILDIHRLVLRTVDDRNAQKLCTVRLKISCSTVILHNLLQLFDVIHNIVYPSAIIIVQGPLAYISAIERTNVSYF